jgi:hypothetical protein
VSLLYEGTAPDQMVADILSRPPMPENFGIEV